MLEQDWSRRAVMSGLGSSLLMPRVASAQAATAATAQTASGLVRGIDRDGVLVFKGMRYGASTAGANRFLPPRPLTPWRDTFDATSYGDQAPQTRSLIADDGPMSEDCLRINIWTPRLDIRRRPVLLWFHGGGFEAGSGSSPLYDGSSLARRGDVVVATINHRLNVFGHCHLAKHLGGRYATSGNAGFLDLVAAMRWVRQNIAAFGGDPDNIMIFGQSGGGRKVSLSYASPASIPLFARGVVQSGAHLLVQTPNQAGQLTDALLKQLGIAANAASKLIDVPMTALVDAQGAVIRSAGYRFEPVLDGITFTQQPWIPNAPRLSVGKPMMLGNTRTELSAQMGMADPRLNEMTEAALPAAVGRVVGAAKAAQAIDVYREISPQASPAELFFKIATGRAYAGDTIIMAEARAAQGAASRTWKYELAWRTPVGTRGRFSPHSLDLSFVFDNVPAGKLFVGPPSADTAAMANAMSESWIAFARSGNPNNPAIPRWDPYDLDRRATMVFDVPSQLISDPHGTERVFMSPLGTQQGETGRYRSSM
ncbi:carboxylesterase family protein [Sphingomonas sp. H160509]|uniref:carboxylesterase/lipase family protein n=1 Tax=Sphingomonas sp. H160509 TaxID=2955313 RepID=UPI002096D6D3|nr:carboxylesterase family protein [Sphingomonas sp. H160509]MDD1449670.1 carboxylesterase family protein [Sphingomonas sp. H160509]